MDNSVGGELAKRFQEAEEEAGDTTGYRVRITESTGSPLSMLLPSTNPWGPQDCLRKECVTCAQDDNKRIDCKKRNILYESECVICGEERKRMEKSKDWKDTGRGVYVGESSRSIFERAKEHVAGRNSLDEDNHQIKHWISSHEDLLAPPKFKFRIVKTFQDPLTRQLAEAVRIELRGEDILNSKSEFSRCRVPRLRIDMEGWQKKTADKDERKRKDEQSIQLEEDHHHLIEEERLRGEAEESLMEKDLKRKADNKESKRKRRKVERIEGWGQSTSQEEDYHHQEEEMAHSRDWMAEVNLNSQLINTKPMIQVNLVSWGKIKEEKQENIPEGRKEPRRRMKGKLTKAEIKKMKKSHKDIGSLMNLSTTKSTVGPVCEVRPGWKSSQADLTDGARGCVGALEGQNVDDDGWKEDEDLPEGWSIGDHATKLVWGRPSNK